jgi:hypothetical protein
MRNWIRLLIFALVVTAITLTLAPPVRTSAEHDGGGTRTSLDATGQSGRQ